MNLINVTNLAKMVKPDGVSKQAVSKAIKDGLLPKHSVKGKAIMLDLDDENVKFYVENNDPQRVIQKQAAKKKTPNDEPLIKHVENYSDLSANEINQRTKIADMQKKQMYVEILKKKYIPTDYVENWLFRYIDKLNSTMERSAGVFITEMGEKILEAGAVKPEHIESFVNLILEAIHNTKKSIAKDLKKYEPKL